MNRTRILFPAALALWVGFAPGCMSEPEQSAFLVTGASSNGTVSVVARRGAVTSESLVLVNNSRLDLNSRVTTGKNGMLLAPFPAESSDKIALQYTTSDGTETTEEVAPQEGLVAVHGLLTEVDADGDEATRPCLVLIRDDVEAGSAEPTELVVVPACGCRPPPKEGEDHEGEGSQGGHPPLQGECQPPPNGGNPPPEGETPPPEGDSPPPEGQRPPCGCGHPPPQDGSTPPPDRQAPPACAAPVDMKALVGTTITVVGMIGEPKADAPCTGTPIIFQEIVPDDENTAQMAGKVAPETLEDASGCLTFSRTDLFDAAGQVVDFDDRYELVGEHADAIALELSAGVHDLTIEGFPVVGHLGCGYEAFQVTFYTLATE